ncbi:uncharacterized protein LOC118565200 [Fundulus heteroclitus]|uniref:uncharacterized protein LOC118565200 n=1 Tax=Fundulus heteroclitus TaxID=8078 RepID=UPI00165AEB99|nr:uncharacterized protein LOC118565200 [Fundulus heteroclitus]
MLQGCQTLCHLPSGSEKSSPEVISRWITLKMEIVELISTGAEIVMAAIALGQTISELAPQRQCDVQITNFSDRYILANPGMFLCKGVCINPLSPKIVPSESGGALFAKVPLTGHGFSGIITYDLFNISTSKITEQMVVYFKVPYDLNLKANKYAVGVFDVCRGCNVNLHEEMAKKKDITFIRGKAKGPSLTHVSQDVTISATMSDSYSSVIKVSLSDY